MKQISIIWLRIIVLVTVAVGIAPPLTAYTSLLSSALTDSIATDVVGDSVAVAYKDSIGPMSQDTTMFAQPGAKGNQGPRTSPVDIDDAKPRAVLHFYDKHGEPLDEPVMFLATLDTVRKVRSKPIYPAYNGMNIGVNFGDLIFMAFGQRYGSFDIHANVSLWNWLFPVVECGLGYADATPDKQNFTYKVRPSFYAKVGFNYNFLYKSSPDYQVFLGFRAGFSRFGYSLTDITIDSDFWHESQLMQINGLKATSWYGEALAGIQVKIVKSFSLGWSARWHFRFNDPSQNGNKPWFVPGYGGSFPLSMSMSAIWTIPGPSPKNSLKEGEN